MKIRALSKTYGSRVVLRTPEFSLERGRIYAVVGANGSGKTTLARLISGAERCDDGQPVLPGVPVGYMPQKSFAFRMDVRANLLLGSRDRQLAGRLMEELGLGALADMPAHRLSGGETARMALARLLMLERPLLVLDEPTASMDMEYTAASERLIRSRCDSTGAAVMLVTHSLQQARRICDEALFLKDGRLVERGKKEVLLYSPAQPETRAFLDFYGL